MPGEHFAFFDPGALVIVVAGTLLATLARCGLGDIRAALQALFSLATRGFNPDPNRAALARCVPEIRKRGRLCADAPLPPDRELAKLVETYLSTGSFDAMHIEARAARVPREIRRSQAVRVFDYAGELAPIFGLVGTLFAISQLTPAAGASATDTTLAAISTAVLSSLYGVLIAHIVCVPLAGAIDRRGDRLQPSSFDPALDLNNGRMDNVQIAGLTSERQCYPVFKDILTDHFDICCVACFGFEIIGELGQPLCVRHRE